MFCLFVVVGFVFLIFLDVGEIWEFLFCNLFVWNVFVLNNLMFLLNFFVFFYYEKVKKYYKRYVLKKKVKKYYKKMDKRNGGLVLCGFWNC